MSAALNERRLRCVERIQNPKQVPQTTTKTSGFILWRKTEEVTVKVNEDVSLFREELKDLGNLEQENSRRV